MTETAWGVMIGLLVILAIEGAVLIGFCLATVPVLVRIVAAIEAQSNKEP